MQRQVTFINAYQACLPLRLGLLDLHGLHPYQEHPKNGNMDQLNGVHTYSNIATYGLHIQSRLARLEAASSDHHHHHHGKWETLLVSLNGLQDQTLECLETTNK